MKHPWPLAILLCLTLPVFAQAPQTDNPNQVAINALATLFIDISPLSTTENKRTYQASIVGKECLIEVTKNLAPNPNQWLVTKLDCKH